MPPSDRLREGRGWCERSAGKREGTPSEWPANRPGRRRYRCEMRSPFPDSGERGKRVEPREIRVPCTRRAGAFFMPLRRNRGRPPAGRGRTKKTLIKSGMPGSSGILPHRTQSRIRARWDNTLPPGLAGSADQCFREGRLVPREGR